MHRLVVIHHRAETEKSVARRYFVSLLCRSWAEQGIEVVHAFGADRFVPADVALLHVNLSIVPREYVELGRRYPTCLNGRLTNICKSVVSSVRTQPDDGYSGQVIVKSELNCAATPERKVVSALAKRRKWWQPRPRALPRETKALMPPDGFREYRVCAKQDVPDSVWAHPGLVVERFIPEQEGDGFVIYSTYVFGEQTITWRSTMGRCIARYADLIEDRRVDTPQDVVEFARKLDVDFGKLDFLMHEGEPVILDVNKTLGNPSGDVTAAHLASGVHAFFGTGR